MTERRTNSSSAHSQWALATKFALGFVVSFGTLVAAFHLEHGRFELLYLAAVAVIPASIATALFNTVFADETEVAGRENLALFGLCFVVLFLLPTIGERSVGRLGEAHRIGILLAMGSFAILELLRRGLQLNRGPLTRALNATIPVAILAVSVRLVSTANVPPTEPVRIDGVDHVVCVSGMEADGTTTPGVFCTRELDQCMEMRESFLANYAQRGLSVSLSECAESKQQVYCAQNPSTGALICGHDRDGCKNRTLLVKDRLGPCYLTAFAD